MTHSLLYLVLSVLLAFVVEASLGFGSTVVTVALGSLWFDLDLLLPAFVPVNVAMSAYLTARYHRHIDRAFLLKRVLPFMGLGLPLGFVVFSQLAGEGLKRGFGAFVVVLSAVELWRLLRPTTEPTSALPRLAERLALVAAGVAHGAFATGGPLAVYVSGRVLHDKAAFRATLSVVWLVLNVALVVAYAADGLVGTESLALSAWFVPSLVLGLALGEWAHHRIALQTFRIIVFVLLLGIGVLLVGKS